MNGFFKRCTFCSLSVMKNGFVLSSGVPNGLLILSHTRTFSLFLFLNLFF